MNKYIIAKNLTDQKLHEVEAHILGIRQRSQKIIERHWDLTNRQRDLTAKDGDSDATGSDKIHLNVGGTEIYALRETLTLIKGSRLEVLFSGRWDKQLLHDEKGCVFLDLDACYFKKIIEHLNLMSANKDGDKNNLNWPTFFDEDEQKTFDLYIDLFRLGKSSEGSKNNNCTLTAKSIKNNDVGLNSFEDLFQVIKNEVQELDEAEKNLDEMEKELDQVEKFVSFFITDDSVQQGEEYGIESECDNDNSISLTSVISDLGSITISSKPQQPHDSETGLIVNLWIDEEIISVKQSTLRACKGSPLADNFSDTEWVKNHTFKAGNGKRVVLMGHSNAFRSMINRLRLLSMMVPLDKLPSIKMNRDKSLEDVASKLFAGKEEFVLGEINIDSQIIGSQSEYYKIITWLEEVNKRGELKLLYRASLHGWSNDLFHSQCDEYSNTLVIVKTAEGYIFGGYSDQSWAGVDQFRLSSASFLFSLKCHAGLSPIKMKVKSDHEGKAVYCNSICGPVFGGGCDVYINSNLGMKVGYTNLSNTYEIPSGASNTFLTGKTGCDQLFDITELEVFQV